MKNSAKLCLLLAGVCSASLTYGQRYNNYDDRNDRNDRNSRRDERQREEDIDDRREFNRRSDENRRYDNRYEDRRGNDRNYDRTFDERDLSKAYDEGYEDGQRSVAIEERRERRENYKHFTFGIYAGANSTRFAGETVQDNQLAGRLGYQAGFFVRGGGRIYGQIGAEYMTSSSDFYRAGDGATIKDITSNVDQKYIQVPAYIGVKLAQSERGVSAIRLAVGAEYAAPLGVNNNAFNFQSGDFRAATVNGLVNLGFDAGPLLVGFVYHYGFADVIANTSNTQRRILSVNVGVKF
ncbi:hypothetical protein [Spirosoma rhododendri]|uniref:Outer membrane protein beta-barrel domain-containing protein n=1 Tax=Spirosoma rhododendri TaxID=2728024 RepID=A0A7L5DNL9_9BACT|nr:hypothetical protein [Spirosoma rhododendri]QJD79152.1 hypothetical protein HH216_12535 [Spirosoma rhododendri]